MNRNKIKELMATTKSEHQNRVEMFMEMMGIHPQSEPDESKVTDNQRLLLAMLVVEETLEYLNGLGIELMHYNDDSAQYFGVTIEDLDFEVLPEFNLEEIIDGACDIKFVVTKALSIFGVPDEPFQQLVDYNNLMKFSGDGHRNEDGKWVKPSDHPKPEIGRLLDAFQYRETKDLNDGINSKNSDELEDDDNWNSPICNHSSNSSDGSSGHESGNNS